MSVSYPFAAIVGQDQLKTALLLCAVDPTLGGVLIRGDKGTAKSTAARGLSELLQPIELVEGCAFNCTPGHPHELCDRCVQPDAVSRPASVPFVNLPLGATEDRVLGSLDFERALKDGKRAFQPGLLASAHRGVLYIDEVNLLADHLVDVLLDVAATGVNIIQREGLSISHRARFSLVGTMNLEEGDLRPQLLDRFGMMVQVTAPNDAGLRSEVVRRRLAYEADPDAFSANWAKDQEALSRQVTAAQALLPTVTVDDELFEFISRICCELEVVSLRADIVMNKASRALAALSGRERVELPDVRYAAELVLPHRRRLKPTDRAGLDKDRLDELMDEASAEQEKRDESSRNDGGQNKKDSPPPPKGNGNEPQSRDNDQSEDATDLEDGASAVFDAEQKDLSWRIEMRTGSTLETSGRRSVATGARRGQYVRAVKNEKPTNLAVDATIRHAVLRNAGELKVSRADLHQKVRVARHGNTIILVVDSSGSMAALKRMEAVKGAVISLLGDAYRRRDQVGVIACRGKEAELVLPPTRSVEIAEEKLRSLPTGGRTPLAHALALATRTLSNFGKDDKPEPLLVVLSDGKANVALPGGGDPWQQSLTAAGSLADLLVPSLVVDTESGYIRLGRARELSGALRGEYVALENLSAETLTLTIRRRLRGRAR